MKVLLMWLRMMKMKMMVTVISWKSNRSIMNKINHLLSKRMRRVIGRSIKMKKVREGMMIWVMSMWGIRENMTVQKVRMLSLVSNFTPHHVCFHQTALTALTGSMAA